jgi:homoserine O-acetyltransferase
MKFLLIINSAANVSGYRFILSKTFESIIDSADNSDDEYGISKNNAVVAINALLFAHSSSKTAFSKLDNDEITVIFEDFADECFFRDMYDFKFRNECSMEYDVVDKLGNIKAKSLFVGTNDNYFNFELDMQPFEELVPNSIVIKQEDQKENYYFEEKDYAPVGEDVIAFLEQFKK